MHQLSRTLVKNFVVAAALGLVAIATWAFTGSAAPAIESRTSVHSHS